MIEAKQAHELGHMSALRDSLARLLADSTDIAAALVSAHFVEGSAPVLASGQSTAALLDRLRDLGYEKHARPLLLAFEGSNGKIVRTSWLTLNPRSKLPHSLCLND